MPAKPITALIVLAWLGTLGWFSYRELWPTLFPGDTPPFVIELADEVGPEIAGHRTLRAPDITWEIYRDDKVIGKAETHIRYFEDDDTFEFTTRIKDLSIEAPLIKTKLVEINSPGVENSYRLSRDGDLRQVKMTTLDRLDDREVTSYKSLALFGMTVHANFVGTVVGDKLYRRVTLELPFVGKVEPVLEPVPAPEGSVLNPLQPVPKIKNLKPGRRWRMQVMNPMADLIQPIAQAIADKPLVKRMSGKKDDFQVPQLSSGPKYLDAEVLDETAELKINDELHRCYVIEYRGDERPAHTYVRIRDGAVMRQEAYAFGTLIALQRQ
jgi:hypothetical protein